MIRSRIVTKIGHLTHNQVVAGSSPAGPGGIVQKNQTASLNYPGYPGEKYNYYYTQGNTAHPHATSKVWDRRNHKQYTYGFDGNGNPTTTHEQYAPWRAPPGSILGTWYWFNGVR